MAMAMTACHRNPFLSEWENEFAIPSFEEIRISDYIPAIKVGINEQNAEIEAIIANPETPDFENTVAAFDRSGAILGRVSGVLFNLSESEADDAMNAVVGEAMPMLSEHEDNIFMNHRRKSFNSNILNTLVWIAKSFTKSCYNFFVFSIIKLDLLHVGDDHFDGSGSAAAAVMQGRRKQNCAF